jgi:conjugal transfer pilus assembly protein TraB
MKKINEKLATMSANTRRLLNAGLILVPLLFVLVFVAESDPISMVSASTPEINDELLFGGSAKEVGIEALSTKLDSLSKLIKTQQKNNEILENKLKTESLKREKDARLWAKKLDENTLKYKKSIDGIRLDSKKSLQENQVNNQSVINNALKQMEQSNSKVASVVQAPQQTWEQLLSREEPTQTENNGNNNQAKLNEPVVSSKINVYEEANVTPKKSVVKKLSKTTRNIIKKGSLYLPAGSILTGTMMTGMVAPTSTNSRRDPVPALIRIKKEAILPNHFKMDVKECFLLMSGYGELSAERVHLRGERFTCVLKDRSVVELKLESYIVGEDGKEGLRGRLVSREGQVIAKAMGAGFLSGISEITKPTAITGLQTNPGASTLFQSPNAGSAVQAGTFSGVSSAADKLSEYYISMAEKIFPVIEIGSGRRVTVIVTKGTKLASIEE